MWVGLSETVCEEGGLIELTQILSSFELLTLTFASATSV
jgi:hypothetical protein